MAQLNISVFQLDVGRTDFILLNKMSLNGAEVPK